jgi:hypothetical protein
MRPTLQSSVTLCALIALSGLSCGGMEPVEATTTITLRHGSRLRHKLITAEDGAIAAGTGLYDTKLQSDCSFQVSEDGMMRCLPIGAYIQPQLFLDVGCTQRFVTSSKCLPATKYVVDYSSVTCGAQNRELNLTELTTPPAMLYYQTATACSQLPNTYNVYRNYSLGTPAVASTFVGGMEMN